MLTTKQIDGAKPKEKNYKLSDKNGMFLLVKTNGSKLWQYNYTFKKVQGTKSYGPYPKVTLAQAREKHAEFRELLDRGLDPKTKQKSTGPTFKECAERWYKAKSPRWTIKHARSVWKTLEDDIFPHIGREPIADIQRIQLVDTMDAVQSRGIGDMAHKIAQRVTSVFDYTQDIGLINSNPANDLTRVLKPKPAVKPRAAVPKQELPELLRQIYAYWGDLVTRVGLMVQSRVFVRPIEVVSMKWTDLRPDDGVWVIPEEDMKGEEGERKPHVVPLPPRVWQMIELLRPLNGEHVYVFASMDNPKKPISTNALLFALYRVGYRGRMTTHGFRAVASTILNESGLWHKDAVERQLAHKEKDEVRGAYNRAEHFEERKRMMQWWSDYLDDLVPLDL